MVKLARARGFCKGRLAANAAHACRLWATRNAEGCANRRKDRGQAGASEQARPSSQYRRRSLLQLSLQQFDLSGKRAVGSHQILDFADGMQDSGMVSAAAPPAEFRWSAKRH